MLYTDIEREIMANAMHTNMRTSSPAVLRSIQEIVDGYVGERDWEGLRVLDIGPGQCDLLDIMKRKGARTFGVDYDPAVVKLGELRGHTMTLHNMSKGWPYAADSFDGIFCRASINCFWFADPTGNDRLKGFLDQLLASLSTKGWLWILPWNNPPADVQPALVDSMRKSVSDWAKAAGILVEVVGEEEKKKFLLSYSLPYIEVWTKNCRPSPERDPNRRTRWVASQDALPAPKVSGAYAAYEACRKRLLAGSRPVEERACLDSILAYPGGFLERAGNGDTLAHGSNPGYAAFIASRPTAEVVFGYLASRLKGLTQGRLDKEPGSKGRVYGWGWVYWGRAAVFAYEATGETRFVDIVLDAYERLLNERDDSLRMIDGHRKRLVRSWGVQTPESPLRANEVTATGLALLPMCDLLLSRAGEAMSSDFRERLQRSVAECLDEFVDELVVDEATGGGYFRSPFDGSVEALNHSHLLGAAMAKMFLVTGNEAYRNVAERLTRFFLNACVLEDNGTYSWAYAPVPGNMQHEHPPMSMLGNNMKNSIGGEAFYKASVTVELPLAARQADLVVSEVDLRRIADSFLRNVIKGTDDLNIYVSSRKIRPAEEFAQKYTAQYMLICGFGLLDEVDPSVRRALIRLFSSRPDWFPGGWFGGPAGSMALAHFMRRTKTMLDD